MAALPLTLGKDHSNMESTYEQLKAAKAYLAERLQHAQTRLHGGGSARFGESFRVGVNGDVASDLGPESPATPSVEDGANSFRCADFAAAGSAVIMEDDRGCGEEDPASRNLDGRDCGHEEEPPVRQWEGCSSGEATAAAVAPSDRVLMDEVLGLAQLVSPTGAPHSISPPPQPFSSAAVDVPLEAGSPVGVATAPGDTPPGRPQLVVVDPEAQTPPQNQPRAVINGIASGNGSYDSCCEAATGPSALEQPTQQQFVAESMQPVQEDPWMDEGRTAAAVELEAALRRIAELEAELAFSEATVVNLQTQLQQSEVVTLRMEYGLAEKEQELTALRSTTRAGDAAQVSSLALVAELQERLVAKERQLDTMRSHADAVACELERRQETLEALELRLQQAERAVRQPGGPRGSLSPPLVGSPSPARNNVGFDVTDRSGKDAPTRLDRSRLSSCSARTESPSSPTAWTRTFAFDVRSDITDPTQGQSGPAPVFGTPNGLHDGSDCSRRPLLASTLTATPCAGVASRYRSDTAGTAASSETVFYTDLNSGDGGYLRAADAPARVLPSRRSSVQRCSISTSGTAAAELVSMAAARGPSLSVDVAAAADAEIRRVGTESQVGGSSSSTLPNLEVKQLRQNVDDLESIVTQMVGDKTRSVSGLEQKLAELETMIGQATRTQWPLTGSCGGTGGAVVSGGASQGSSRPSAVQSTAAASAVASGLEVFLAGSPQATSATGSASRILRTSSPLARRLSSTPANVAPINGSPLRPRPVPTSVAPPATAASMHRVVMSPGVPGPFPQVVGVGGAQSPLRPPLGTISGLSRSQSPTPTGRVGLPSPQTAAPVRVAASAPTAALAPCQPQMSSQVPVRGAVAAPIAAPIVGQQQWAAPPMARTQTVAACFGPSPLPTTTR